MFITRSFRRILIYLNLYCFYGALKVVVPINNN